MLRRTLRALAFATMMAVALIPAAPAALATVGQDPTISNVTTGAGDVHYGSGQEVIVGDALRGNDNDWFGIGVYVYQWNRCMDSRGEICEAIAGATNPSYTATASDYGATLQFCATVPRGATRCSLVSSVVLARHADTDGDGVPNYADRCPSVAASTSDGCVAPATPAEVPTAGSDVPTSAPGSSEVPDSLSTNASGAPALDAPNGTGASAAARLTAVTANRSRTMTVLFGKAAVIRGTLTGPSGRPIVGATVAVMVRRAATTAQFAEVAKLVTGADGRFAYVSAPGASRIIRFAYRAFSDDASYADTTDVSVLVKGALSLTATKRSVGNRQSTIFRGTLRGKPVPAGGVVVDLQVWFHNKWRTFATPRTNKKGAFRFKYRFTQGSARWIFRARFRKDSLYPYELSYSKKLAVLVRH